MNQEEKYSTIDDVAEYFAVSVSTVRNWLRQKIITPESYLKVGNTYRFKVSLVERDLRGGAGDKAPQFDIDTSNEERPNRVTDRLPPLPEPLLGSDEYPEDKPSTIYLLSNPAFPFLIKVAHAYDDEPDWLDILNSNPSLPADYEVADKLQLVCGGRVALDTLLKVFSPWKYGDKSELFLLDVGEIKDALGWLEDALEHKHDLDVLIRDLQAHVSQYFKPVEEWGESPDYFGWKLHVSRLYQVFDSIYECAEFGLHLATGTQLDGENLLSLKKLLDVIQDMTFVTQPDDIAYMARPLRLAPPVPHGSDGNACVTWSKTCWDHGDKAVNPY